MTIFEKTEEKTVGLGKSLLLKRQLQWLLFFRVIALTLLLGISALLQSKEHDLVIPPIKYIALFISGLYVFSILSAILLNKIKTYRNFAYFQIITDSLMTTFLVLYTGGSQSIFSLIYFFPIITGALLLFRKGALLLAAVCSIEYASLLLFEYLGFHSILPKELWKTTLSNIVVVMHIFAIHGLSFFLVAILSLLLSERLRKTEAALSQTALDFDRLNVLYKQIFDDISTGIITVDSSNSITSFNRAAEEITGYSLKDIHKRSIDNFFPKLVPNLEPLLRPVVNMTRKDGENIPIGYSWAKLNMPDANENFRVYTFQDLSQIKKMEDQIRQAEKMAAIGEMAAGIAHEFRNPIAAISGAAQMLTQEFPNDQGIHRLLNIITRESDRMEGTIAGFLLFSKPTSPNKKWFSLHDQVDEALNLLKQAQKLDERFTITMKMPDNLDCWADPQQIKQVLVNLISNSLSAMKKSGGDEIQISAQEERGENGKDTIVIVIMDNGPGIANEIIESIFNPFFTTREHGTGLGLAIVKQIIDSHDGTIEAATIANKGARFTISLPLP